MDFNLDNFMPKAMEQAQDALANQEVPVGCVFIYNNEIIAKSRNTVNETKNATRHAEFNCIDQVIDYCVKMNLSYEDVFSKIDVVVTVEPCIMCADALFKLNVRNIVYGCANDRFGGKTVLNVSQFHTDKRTIVKGGVKADEAMQLLKDFYKGTNPNAPCPNIKKTK